MDFFIYLFYIFGIMFIVVKVYKKLSEYIIRMLNNNNDKKYKTYVKKKLMTNYEKYFYDIFVELEKEYSIRIQPQVNLATVVRKVNNDSYYTDLFRNIDFGIFSNNYDDVLLLIEINDKTHNDSKRIKRDKKVKEIADEAGIKLISFYSNYPNTKEYVKNRIIKELNIQ